MRKDYVDSCVFLGVILEQGGDCKDYVNTLGYKNRNVGILSHFVLSEIFLTILTKIKDREKVYEKIEKLKAFEYIDGILNNLLNENAITINKLNTIIIDEELVAELKNANYSITDDDIFHILEAIKSKCQFFVTTDKVLLENVGFRNFLASKHNLKLIGLSL